MSETRDQGPAVVCTWTRHEAMCSNAMQVACEMHCALYPPTAAAA